MNYKNFDYLWKLWQNHTNTNTASGFFSLRIPPAPLGRASRTVWKQRRWNADLARAKGKDGEARADRQMGTLAKEGGESFPAWQRLFDNQVPAIGIWEKGGIELQQRYDKSKRPDPVRVPSRRRHRIPGAPDRGIAPVPSQGQETASTSRRGNFVPPGTLVMR